MIGTIKRLVTDKNFGFIFGDDKLDYFFHGTSLQNGLTIDDVRVGDEVTFSPTDTQKGKRAEGVTVVKETAATA